MQRRLSLARRWRPHQQPDRGAATRSKNLEKIETIRDGELIEGADPTIAATTGRIHIRFADMTLIELADGNPVGLEFAYRQSARAKLVLIAREVYLPEPKLAVEGPGIQASFEFRGEEHLRRSDVHGHAYQRPRRSGPCMMLPGSGVGAYQAHPQILAQGYPGIGG